MPSSASPDDVNSSQSTTPLVDPSSSSSPDDPPKPAALLSVPEGSYSPFVAYCVTVNYILGVGVIGMPKAFNTGGWLLSTVILLIVSVMATFTALWYVEVGHRANRKEKEEAETELEPLPHTALTVPSPPLPLLCLPPPLPPTPPLPPPPSHSILSDPAPAKQPRRIEANELISIFLSPNTGRVYEFLLCVYMMGSMWSYASVFATGLAANIAVPFLHSGNTCVVSEDGSWSCYSLYLFYCALFACIVVPIATRNLTEMKAFVVALAMLRFVAITCMVVTTIDLMYHYPTAVSSTTSPPYYSDTPVANWGGLGVIFPVCIFAQIFHHSVPGIAYPLQDKKKVPQVFAACLFSMFVLYSSLAVTLTLYFGSTIASQCTLNWQTYTGYEPGRAVQVSFLTGFTRQLIVLFPPLDVMSAFPLKAITVGNNLQTRFLKREEYLVRRKFIPFRLFAAIVPILGACVFSDLTKLLTYTGSLGIVIAFLFPTVLQWKSRREVKGRSGVLEGWVERVVDSEWAVYGVGGFCLAGLCTVIIQQVIGAASGH